jgi:hypothetical protein
MAARPSDYLQRRSAAPFVSELSPVYPTGEAQPLGATLIETADWSRAQSRLSRFALAAYFTTRTRSTVTSAPPLIISSRIGSSLSTCA